MQHDTVIRGGTIVTASDTYSADIAIKDGRIATLGTGLSGDREIDATGRFVLPGGIESHCHIAQESSTGLMTADDYRSGSISAAFGGNTTIIPFAAQQPGQPVSEVIPLYHSRAESASVLDWSYHLIISDTKVDGFADDMAAAFTAGVTSFKVFMTYGRIRLDDAGFLEVLANARTHGALTMVHAENDGILTWMAERLVDRGYTAPQFHAPSRPAMAEAEAINRAVTLARLVDAPLLIVHVSTPEGMEVIRRARADGAPILAETCPQYLFLTADDLAGPEGGKYICSPPLRDTATQEALWHGLRRGVFDFWSSDHAPYRYDETGKRMHGDDATFRQIANGMPGIGMRLPLLFSEGVVAGRLSMQRFVELTSANQARRFGVPGKGTITVGADADLAIWDAEARWTVTAASQHDNMDYTPFEGREMTGKPETVIRRGEVVIADGALHAAPGSGKFLKRARFDRTDYDSAPAPELNPGRNGGADLL